MIPYLNGPTNISESFAHRTTSQRKRRHTGHKTNAWFNRHKRSRRQARRNG